MAFRLGPRDRDVVRVADRKNRIRLLRETSALRPPLAGRSRRPLRLLLDCGKVLVCSIFRKMIYLFPGLDTFICFV